ncbi:hypothetical protein C8J57DRAFT_1538212 [Mycena rebaudengoi]|nr:hypothetical protein C8J57DRAFT_1538212 [Mycena rebaudengoi]
MIHTTWYCSPFPLFSVHLLLSYSAPRFFSSPFESPFSNFSAFSGDQNSISAPGIVSKHAYSFGVILQALIIDSRTYFHHFHPPHFTLRPELRSLRASWSPPAFAPSVLLAGQDSVLIRRRPQKIAPSALHAEILDQHCSPFCQSE